MFEPELHERHEHEEVIIAVIRAKQSSGQTIFRFDTFGDEQLWTNVLRMHEAIPSVNPVTALAVGLKVDVDALPPALIAALQAGEVKLTDPAVTIELLRLNAVVGIIGKVDDLGQLTSIGTTCALCQGVPCNLHEPIGCVDLGIKGGVGKLLHPLLPKLLLRQFGGPLAGANLRQRRVRHQRARRNAT